MIDIRTNGMSSVSTSGLAHTESDLVTDLRTWWDDHVEADDDPFAEPPRPPRAGTIFEVVPVIDSLGVVTALLTIEKHVGFTVPVRIIKRGGYGSFAEMVADLLPKVQALVLRKRKEAA
jgi:hypothetical protein